MSILCMYTISVSFLSALSLLICVLVKSSTVECSMGITCVQQLRWTVNEVCVWVCKMMTQLDFIRPLCQRQQQHQPTEFQWFVFHRLFFCSFYRLFFFFFFSSFVSNVEFHFVIVLYFIICTKETENHTIVYTWAANSQTPEEIVVELCMEHIKRKKCKCPM